MISIQRLFIVFFMAIALPLSAAGQSAKEDVVYLKNGGILRGEIIDTSRDESLKIQTAGRNVVVVMMSEVEEVTREAVPSAGHFKSSGYVNYTGMDLLYDHGHTSVRFRMVNGYQFTSRFSAGLGVGITSYNDPLNLVPLFLDMKFKFLEANTTPYLTLKGGYSFSLAPGDSQITAHNGGFMFNPAAGLQFDTRSGFGWYFTAGYNLEHASFTQRRWDDRLVKTEINYKRLQFGFGLVF